MEKILRPTNISREEKIFLSLLNSWEIFNFDYYL